MIQSSMAAIRERFWQCTRVGFLALAALIARTGGDAAEAPGLDRYGGWRDIVTKATGWFRLDTVGGRSLLVTPEGHGFVALGINHLNTLRGPGKGEQDLFHSRYDADWEKFAVELHQQFTSWGFNTVDHGVEVLKRYWPYFASRGLVRTSKYYGKPGSSNAWEFPDVFDPAVASRMAAEVEAFCREHRESKNLIAYLWTDTPTWDLHKTRRFRQTDWVSEIRKLPAASPGWREYGAFLERTYRGDIEQFNRAYGLSARDFAHLQEVSLTSLDVDRYEVERDDQRFLGEIARRYYEIVGTAMRRHDPNHLIFGEKYLMGDIPPQVLEAALPYIDALAVQPGDGYLPIYTPGDLYPAKEMAELHTISGKPIFICDHQISFPTRIHPHVIWPYHQRKTEEEAAAATGNFVRAAFADPFVIGYMRCQYIDRFAASRGALKQGLVRHDGSLYDQLVAETSRANADAIRIVRRAAGME